MSDRRKKGIDIKSFMLGLLITVGVAVLILYINGLGPDGIFGVLMVAGSGALIGSSIGYIFGNSS